MPHHSLSSSSTITAPGPLVVSTTNPRYFTVAGAADQRAVYLTGSHIWNNFHDGMGPGAACAAVPEPFDFDAYLAFLVERGHNLIRLWRWEQFQSQAAGGNFHLCMTPQPWRRDGPSLAKDGQPKFNLDAFDPAYFDRLRNRVIAAGRRGIYVAVMFFDGWALHLSPAPDNIEGHPFHAANNVNGIRITSIRDAQVLPLDPRIQAVQTAYLHRVVDTVQDLPNVLYEVANESCGGGSVDQVFAAALGLGDPQAWGDSTAWQYWVIDVVQRYTRERGYMPHPIGMTMQFPVPEQTKVNDPLFASAADWISPGYDDARFADGGHPNAPGSPPSRWFDDPPPSDGRKVIISDTDHYAPGGGDALWAWKSFVRGHHPILMDFGLIGGVEPPDSQEGSPDDASFTAFEPARWAMGDTRRYAERLGLLAMTPRGELSSTGYALAHPGVAYLILQSEPTGAPFTVTLAAGTYQAEWFCITDRTTHTGAPVTAGRDEVVTVTPPAGVVGPVVLSLQQTTR